MSNNIEQKFADTIQAIIGYVDMADLIMFDTPSSSKDYKQILNDIVTGKQIGRAHV